MSDHVEENSIFRLGKKEFLVGEVPVSVHHGPDDYVWNGEYAEIEVEDWWCPTEERMVMCPGPCPDGTEHGPAVKKKVQAKLMVLREVTS